MKRSAVQANGGQREEVPLSESESGSQSASQIETLIRIRITGLRP
jgi:hypothetical protein